MKYTLRHLALPCLASVALLSGCAGSSSQQEAQAIYTIPTPQATPYAPPVSENYIISRAPSRPVEPTYAATVPVEESPAYRSTGLFEVDTPPTPTPTAVPVVRRIDPSPARYENGFAPIEAEPPATAIAEIPDDPGFSARERAAETAAERTVRREAARSDRANPKIDRRSSILGRFVTRAKDEPRPQPATRAVRQPEPIPTPAPTRAVRQPEPAPADTRAVTAQPTPRPQSFAERSVARAPIPGLKPYILARTPSPSSKPRRAAPQPTTREFEVASAATLPNAIPAAIPPSSVTIPTEPGVDLSARFFPTPGKPSTLGTDRDQPLDVAAIDAARYGIGGGVQTAVDADEATAEWTDAVRLIEAGEVEALAILEDADLVLTLCSGRDILTTPPDLAAAATLTAPQIICGQNKPLALR